MPDGKRNPIPPEEGGPEGVNCYYDDLQNSGNSHAKRLPLSLNSRSLHNLSDRLLRAMVANEIKKTLGAEDNKKLVAHHRPVLQSENESGDSEMVVVGVVLTAKQSQNDEVTKAIEMLRRNGVSCVCFTLNKDTPSPNGAKKDDITSVGPNENGLLPEELFKALASQSDENCLSSEDTSEKKVSSPTVSTTSDYASPLPQDDSINIDSIEIGESMDASCTSTTSPTLRDVEPSNNDSLPPASPSDGRKSGDQNPLDEETPPTSDEIVQNKVTVDTTALRRKRRRKRLFPFVSRRKARNKRKKPTSREELPTPEEKAESCTDKKKRKVSQEQEAPSTEQVLPEIPSEPTHDATETTAIPTKADPYEFEDSDMDAPVSALFETFKTPNSRNGLQNVGVHRKNGSSSQKGGNAIKSVMSSKRPLKKKGSAKKRSPRKRLTFPKPREFSPDITDHVESQGAQPFRGGAKLSVVQLDSITSLDEETEDVKNKCSPTESCVQPISTDNKKIDTTQTQPSKDDYCSLVDEVKLVLSTPANGLQKLSPEPLVPVPSPQHCDADIRASHSDVDDKQVVTRDTKARVRLEPPLVAQETCNVQNKEIPRHNQSSNEASEFIVPATPNDSLQDGPDSMQLRRSSFYSSISRNVRTNMEKYLDGRPQDLKAPKRSKKIKNGFLLHHGDNFPDDPEAPYQLNLATQVLLKLNKRRVKCKPKDDKGKSLLSYLKLQPKRVSRVGKHSKVTEDPDNAATNETSSVFSGEWTVTRKYICNICGQVENSFWDIVMHKGELHPGIVVTHVELPDNPPEGFRGPPSPRVSTTLPVPPPCTKCSTAFNTYSDLHRHVFECAGNAAVLEDATSKVSVPKKKKGKRKRGFKRRISSLPKKSGNGNNIISNSSISKNGATTAPSKSGEITKRRNSEVFQCVFCTREFKTEGWLKNHVSLSHSLPISIPLEKLSLPTRASIASSRRFAAQLTKPSKQLSRET